MGKTCASTSLSGVVYWGFRSHRALAPCALSLLAPSPHRCPLDIRTVDSRQVIFLISMEFSKATVNGAAVQEVLYEQLARVGKVVGHPKRIQLLELLCQGERTVDELAEASGMLLTTCSAQLQVLRQARLADTRRAGTHVHYRAAGDEVCRLVAVLRAVSEARLTEVSEVLRQFRVATDDTEPLGRDEFLARVRSGRVSVIDVRPSAEYLAGHVPGAISIPLEELEASLRDLDPLAEIVAYCRGPQCVLAPQAVALLRARGYRAVRLEEGMPEWRLAGLPVAIGAAAGTLP